MEGFALFGFLQFGFYFVRGTSAINTSFFVHNIVWFGNTYHSLFCSTCWDLASSCWRDIFRTDLQQNKMEDKLRRFQWLNQFMAARVNSR